MRCLGHILSMQECADLISDNGGVGGFLERDRFFSYWAKKSQQNDSEQDLITAFQAFDKDGKGYITSVELRHVLTNLGDRLSDDVTEAIVTQADPSGGGSISYATFVRSMLQAMK